MTHIKDKSYNDNNILDNKLNSKYKVIKIQEVIPNNNEISYPWF